jgi:hypothetical protein
MITMVWGCLGHFLPRDSGAALWRLDGLAGRSSKDLGSGDLGFPIQLILFYGIPPIKQPFGVIWVY